MRIKSIFSIMLIILFGASVLPSGAVTIVDDFNRASLGTNWAADPEYRIQNNTLELNTTVASWEFLAIYKGLLSPYEVSMKFDPAGSTTGVNSAGLAIYLDSNNPATANGYFIMRRNGVIRLNPVINGVVNDGILLASVTSARPATAPGDIVKITALTDGTGHHFTVSLNNQVDGVVSDPGKLYGNSNLYYAGLCLYGNQNNNVDDYTLRAQQIFVTSPAGGESWVVGSAHDITWNISDFSADVKIEYSTDSGTTWTTIAASTANDGTYSWTIPNTPSTNCLVRISDAADGFPWGISPGTFEITSVAQTITVTSPNGGESWAASSVHDITWTSSGGITNVAIMYSADNGTTWSTVIASTPNDGTHSWTLPASNTSQGLIKVQDTDGTPSDVSNAVFNITTSSVTLSIQSASGEQSETVILNVSLTNQIPIRGLQFRLTDTQDYLTCDLANVTPINRASTFTVNVDEPNGYINVVMANTTSFTSIAAGSGSILQIPYIVDGAAPYGESSSLTFSEVRMSNDSSQPVVPTLVNGNFYYIEKGDINGSGTTDQADVDRIIEIILGLGPVPTDYENMAADMDKDGDIDMYDALRVIDEI
ncbi:hypothetical protein JXQ31_06415 [candidate division KSB1 bacterium]|nr:hypothetical protein [candidate division KSB1 bacterium]